MTKNWPQSYLSSNALHHWLTAAPRGVSSPPFLACPKQAHTKPNIHQEACSGKRRAGSSSCNTDSVYSKLLLNAFKIYALIIYYFWASLVSSGKEAACNAGDPGSIPGSGRSPGEGNDYLLQYSHRRIPWTEEPGGLQSTGSQRV